MRDRLPLRYILDGKTPIPCEDLLQWAIWMDDPKNVVVASTECVGLHISTVFLGRNWLAYSDSLILFETMVFESGSLTDKYIQRYCTWDEAVAGHGAIVALIQSGLAEQGID